MKTAIIAAIVAAIVSAGAASAGTAWINGTSIRPGTIRISRLAPGAIVKLKGQQGPVGPQGQQGPQGEPGPAGADAPVPRFLHGWLCVAPDGSVTWGGGIPATPFLPEPGPSCPGAVREIEVAVLGVLPKTL